VSVSVLALLLLAAAPPEGTALFVEPADPQAVQGLEPEDCDAALGKALRKEKLRVVADAGEASRARVAVLDCYRLSRSRLESHARQGGERIPHGSIRTHQADQEYAAKTVTDFFAGLKIRVRCGDWAQDFESDLHEKKLDAAAKTVAGRARRWLAETCAPAR
jgi:hypothetical protein